LIAHEDLAAEVVAIFEQLLQLRYPIEKIRTVDTYPAADDELSWKTTTPRRSTAETFPAPAAGLSTRSAERSTSTRCSIPTSTGRATSNPRTPHHTAHTFKSNPSFRTNLRGCGERSSTRAAAAPASAEPFTSGQPIGAESKTLKHDGFSPAEFAVHVARRIHYTELYALCFTKEIAMLLALSSSQFAVAVGRNYT
jgi:hypothetical protein